MRVLLPVVCSHRIKNSYCGLVVVTGPHLPPSHVQTCISYQMHGATPALRDGCELCTSPCSNAAGLRITFFFSTGSKLCHCVKKKTVTNYENYKAFFKKKNKIKNPELSKPCVRILHPSACISPPYVPPYFHHFCSIQASPGVSSGTSVQLRPLLCSTSSFWLNTVLDCPAGGSLFTSGAAGLPDGPIHHTGGGGGRKGVGGGGCLIVDFI